MAKIVECVPNFSEGRDKDKIERIISVLKNNKQIKLINYEADADYNRTVVTLIGEPEPMIDAIIELTEVCLKEIDLNKHSGEHARMGAIDVIPFIPIHDVKMSECVSYAEKTGQLISEKFNIPCFLYAEAARHEDRVSLPNIRKGEFEGMEEKIKDPHWKPDFGPAKRHPSFGSIGIGARDFLIAYNIDIDTRDEKKTNNFAKAIRNSSGGFSYVQAGPVYLENRGHTQVTMNILNYKKNPIYRVFETVKMEAKRYHYNVPSAEIVGLIPKDAIMRSLKYYYAVNDIEFNEDMSFDDIVRDAANYLQLRDFHKSKIIDYFL
ncbi:MAG: glutamate formimidoyltransferase [Candidatus Izemoplasmatales bacterium]|uniref:glutamate formimidoyltransferase n=1 Tax=Hujiaoplasma nucleasis TaxID=2725268 RepID=A0A7L6N5U1_9MOLU|nr:glutamate formimidoyltransferase [Hujiaoplasma nucleasis]QLY40921.1 glutamate formimidoyltransferase [Hujiaoplasma nucleasis]